MRPMWNVIIVTTIVVLAVSLGMAKAGQGSEQAAAGHATATHAEKSHAAAAARPGSHEDWCDEHGVPESLCTRCNAKLIPAFKATGDWCEEHGLPESQCLICNPDLKIERPPKTEGK